MLCCFCDQWGDTLRAAATVLLESDHSILQSGLIPPSHFLILVFCIAFSLIFFVGEIKGEV